MRVRGGDNEMAILRTVQLSEVLIMGTIKLLSCLVLMAAHHLV